jgi:hypothetical protein
MLAVEITKRSGALTATWFTALSRGVAHWAPLCYRQRHLISNAGSRLRPTDQCSLNRGRRERRSAAGLGVLAQPYDFLMRIVASPIAMLRSLRGDRMVVLTPLR